MNYLTAEEFESLAASVDAGIERYLRSYAVLGLERDNQPIARIELAEVVPAAAARLTDLTEAILQAKAEQRPAMMARLKRMRFQVQVLVLEGLIDALLTPSSTRTSTFGLEHLTDGWDRDARQAREALACFGPRVLLLLQSRLRRSRRCAEQLVLIELIAAIGATLPRAKLQDDDMIWRVILPGGLNSYHIRAKRAREALDRAHALLRAAARRPETAKA
jgi:hypothetical protein